MNEFLPLVTSFAAGVLLGLLYFLSLWLTVRDLDHASHPGLRVSGSLLVRLGVTLAAFYFFARYLGWQHVLAAAIGFLVARILVVHHISPGSKRNHGSGA